MTLSLCFSHTVRNYGKAMQSCVKQAKFLYLLDFATDTLKDATYHSSHIDISDPNFPDREVRNVFC